MFGKTLRGQYTKNDYIIESSNSRYPYASRIPFIEAVSLYAIYPYKRYKSFTAALQEEICLMGGKMFLVVSRCIILYMLA